MHTLDVRPTPAADESLRTLRVIGGSLGAGVTLFALVGWFLHRQGGPARAATDPSLLLVVALALAFVAVLAAILWWRARVAPLLDSREAPGDRAARAAAIQTAVIIVWSLLEAPALFPVIVYFLHGTALAGALGVVLIWAGLAVTWPKPEWFRGAL